MDLSEKKTIARILKVNHAGESGAIRIYQAQALVSRYLHPSLLPFLRETLQHEIDHCRIFRDAMYGRDARPCHAMWLWSLGGWILGATTALLGKNMVWICTEAVEETVHRHLEDQLEFLEGKDQELHAAILSIQAEELSHLNHARNNIRSRGLLDGIVRNVIMNLTELVIWLSTYGDSSRMAKAIRMRK